MILDGLTWLVVDCETTGTDPMTDSPVEIAAVKYRGEVEIDNWSTLVNPGFPIPPESSGVHHIIDQDVTSAPTPEEALSELATFVSNASLIVAHNAAFDRSFLAKIDEPIIDEGEIRDSDIILCKRWLCTFRLARHLLPNAANHKLSTLRYLLDLDVPRDRLPHGALSDAQVTGALTIKLAALYEQQQGPYREPTAMIEYAQSNIEIRSWPFGMHYGRPIDDAPADYMRWALLKHDRVRQDDDLRRSIESALMRRTSSLPTAG